VGKGFRCSFYDDIVCPHKKSEKSVVLGKCEKCPHYLRFLHEMDGEEERFFDEVDGIRREGKWV
jgi:hypothetical protein